jgi:hypothetical protein
MGLMRCRAATISGRGCALAGKFGSQSRKLVLELLEA